MEGEIGVIFRRLDKNGDGKISAAELCDEVSLMGGKLLLKEAEMAVESLDLDGDGMLELEDFVKLLESGSSEEEKLVDLKEAFAMYDVDNCGFITPHHLKNMLTRLGYFKTIDECKSMIYTFDLDGDGDGALSFHEFNIMMK